MKDNAQIAIAASATVLGSGTDEARYRMNHTPVIGRSNR
jgi:hypothetical protein